MKNLKLLFITLLTGLVVSSCVKNDIEDTGIDREANQKRIDSTLLAQKEPLKLYAEEHFSNPQYNEKSGIWFEILTETSNTSYEYVVFNGGFESPKVEVNYVGKLLSGKVFDESKEPAKMEINYGKQIAAWPFSFFPKTVTVGSQVYETGLLPKGLQKGHKIRFVAPSPMCYDNVNVKDKDGIVVIPKDSPLEFTIEVVNIR